MLKKVIKRELSLLLAIMVAFGMLINVNIGYVYGAQLELKDKDLGIEADPAQWQILTNTSMYGKITSKMKGGCGAAAAAESVMTMKNKSSERKTLLFDIKKEDIRIEGNKDKAYIKVNGANVDPNGEHFSIPIESGGTVTVEMKTDVGDNKEFTTSVKLKNIKLMREKPNVETTFIPSVGGKLFVDGDLINETTVKTADSSKEYLLKAVSDGGCKFVGWKNEEEKIISYDEFYTYYNDENGSVKPYFEKSDKAVFEVDSECFTDLNEAAAAAKKNSNTSLIKLLKKGKLAAGTYNIPEGVTLLIPFDKEHSIFSETDLINEKNADKVYHTPSEYEDGKLTLEKNTVINVEGTVNISSKTAYLKGGLSTGMPSGKYGSIDMDENSRLVLKNGGELFALGYVTGKGEVVAEKGSCVWENFQFRDFRGGSASSDIYLEREKYRVFPLEAYTVQNIESKLQLNRGATEKVVTGVIVQGSTYVSIATFVGEGGLFHIREGSLIKKYNGKEERLQLGVDGNVDVNGLSINVGLVSLNSAEYVLPISSVTAIDIEKDGILEMKNDVQLMPRSEVNIKNGGKLIVGKNTNMFLYDSDEWNNRNFGFNALFNWGPAMYSPSRVPKANKWTRKENLDDGKINIDGELIIKGFLYSTNGVAETPGANGGISSPREGGGNTTSKKGTGRIRFEEKSGEGKLYQFRQVKLKPNESNKVFYRIGVLPLTLLNTDGSYTMTSDLEKDAEIAYHTDKQGVGRWIKPGVKISGDLSKIYDGKKPAEEKLNVESESDGDRLFKYYAVKEGDQLEELSSPPVQAGSYKVKVCIAEGENPTAYESNLLNFKISKAALRIKAKNRGIVYGDEPENGGVEYTGFAHGENEGNLEGSLSFEYDYHKGDPVGNYTITPGGLTSPNYDIEYEKGRLTVGKKDLIIRAKNAQVVYGEPPANEGSEYSGFIEGEGPDNLTGSLSYDYTYNLYGDVGTDYEIIPKGLVSDKYNIIFENGTLEVVPKAVNLHWEGFENLKYGQPVNVFASAEGLVNGDRVEVRVAGGENTTPGEHTAEAVALINVGGSEDKAKNYRLPAEKTKIYTVSKGDTSLKLEGNPDKTYDGKPVEAEKFKITKTGSEKPAVISFFKNEECTEKLDAQPVDAGTYWAKAIVEEDGNYFGAESNSLKFTIGKKDLTVKAGDKTVIYGEEPENIGVVYNGFVNGENGEHLQGSLAFEYNYKKGDKVGNYDIVPKGLESKNYNIIYKKGILTVGKRPLKIKAADNQIVYGQKPSDKGVELNGLAEGDGLTDLEGNLTYEYTYSQYEDPGTDYKIIPKGLTSENYSIDFEEGNLSVEAKVLGIAWENLENRVYNDGKQVKARLTGIENEDDVYPITEGTDEFEVGGPYTAKVTRLEGNKKNNYLLPEKTFAVYSISQHETSLKISGNLNKIYDGKEADLSKISYECSRTEEVHVEYRFYSDEDCSHLLNSYPVKAGTYWVRGYVSAYEGYSSAVSEPLKFIIEPKEIGLEWSGTEDRFYGDKGRISVKATGLIEGDGVGLNLIGGDNDSVGSHQAYVEEITGSKAKNYKLPSENSILYGVKPAPLTVTAKDSEIYYGEDPVGNGIECNGFVNNEDESVLTGDPVYEFSGENKKPAGTYDITPKGLTSANYNISFRKGKLNVKRKPVTISWQNTENRYHGDGKKVTGQIQGIVGEDDIHPVLKGHEDDSAGTHVAVIIGLDGADRDNYSPEGALYVEYTVKPAQGVIPVATVDYLHEKLIGLDKNSVYIVDGKAYLSDEEGCIEIQESWMGKSVTIFKKGNNQQSDSEAQELSVHGRPEAPVLTGNKVTNPDNPDGEIMGLDKSKHYEYRKMSDSDWIKVKSGSEDIKGLSVATYEVRLCATASDFSSEIARVTVSDRVIKALRVSILPNKTDYIEGQDLDLTGGVLTASYDNGSEEDLPLSAAQITGYNKNLAGEGQIVTVIFEGKSAEFKVNVRKKQLSEIVISKAPEKISYKSGELFDSKGMEVTAKYDNGTEARVENFIVEPSGALMRKDTKVIVAYEEEGIKKTAEVDIFVDYAEGKLLISGDLGKTYDGKAVEMTGLTCHTGGSQGKVTYNFYSDEDCTVLLEETPKAAGKYWIRAHIESEGDFTEGDSNILKFRIKKAELKLLWKNITGRFENDGKVVTAEAEGVVEGDNVEISVSGGDKTTPGDYTATAELKGSDISNYTLISDKKEYHIEVRPPAPSPFVPANSDQDHGSPDDNQQQPEDSHNNEDKDTVKKGYVLAKVSTAKKQREHIISWNRIKAAEEYRIYSGITRKGKKSSYRLVKVVKGNNTLMWRNRNVKKRAIYKYLVEAYVQNEKIKSPLIYLRHESVKKGVVNAARLKVKEKRTELTPEDRYEMKVKVLGKGKFRRIASFKGVPKIRYLSTDSNIASVSRKGVIEAKKQGVCRVIVFAPNGVNTFVKVVVK